MNAVAIGGNQVHECDQCLGLWVDVTAFEKICADREQQSAVLGSASIAPTGDAHEVNKIRYVPCPICSQLMNRINFARCSGVIVDVCKGHGTWFDRDELSNIVAFIRGGGLETARDREKEELQNERQKLLEEQRRAAGDSTMFIRDAEDHRINGISATSGLLQFLLK
ncbi:MAG TPA: zf-TFIIB domain-containing protein [Pyrinomonadaceae bacterium]|nr:zf-TFIIB domain-containing protein [Pyrinomonadaceae bacterium]